MTNKEYIESNNIGFSDVMKMWDDKTYPCFTEWLKQEHNEHKFKVGDFVRKVVSDRYSKANEYVAVVVDVQDFVYIKVFKRDGYFDTRLLGNNVFKYHNDDPCVFRMFDEDTFEKIF